MLARVGLSSIECMIGSIQLRWLCHWRRMTEDRYPRKHLYGQLSKFVRPTHYSKKSSKDHSKKTMTNFGCVPRTCQANLLDRSVWKSKCLEGVTNFKLGWIEKRELCRARRHQVRDLPHVEDSDLVCRCPGCGRQCSYCIGLRSHMRIHRMGPETERHVIGDIAGVPWLRWFNFLYQKHQKHPLSEFF